MAKKKDNKNLLLGLGALALLGGGLALALSKKSTTSNPTPTGCTSNADCSGSTPICNTSTQTCVQCTSDPAPVICFDGSTIQQERCVNGTIQNTGATCPTNPCANRVRGLNFISVEPEGPGQPTQEVCCDCFGNPQCRVTVNFQSTFNRRVYVAAYSLVGNAIVDARSRFFDPGQTKTIAFGVPLQSEVVGVLYEVPDTFSPDCTDNLNNIPILNLLGRYRVTSDNTGDNCFGIIQDLCP